MVDRRTIARRSPEHTWFPRVQVRVEMNDRDRAIRAVNGAQERQHDGVVPSERDHTRVVLPILRDRHERSVRERIVRQSGERRAMQQVPMTILDLLYGIRIVVRRHGYVATIDDPEPGQERVHFQRHVISTVQRQAARSRAYTSGSETCSRPVRRAGVKGSTEESNVKWDVLLPREALDPWQFRKRSYTREDCLSRDGIVTRICRLVREPDIVQGHLVFIMAIMTHAGCPEGEHEQREKL